MKPLTEQQRRFCEFYVSGQLAGRAYENAGYKVTGRVADASACRLLTNDNAKRYVNELRNEAKAASRMTRESKLEMLCRIASTQEDGDPRVSISAISEENRMTGGYEPERHELKIKVRIGGTGD